MFQLNDVSLLYLHNDPSNLKKNLSFIQKQGIKVFLADTLKTAHDIFQHNKVDILMVDVELKEENGLDFLHSLREKDIFTPVIITTADKNNDYLFDAINLDVSQCLIRPYTTDKMLGSLEVAIKKSLICHPMSFTDLNNGLRYDPINKVINNSDGSVIKLCKKEYMLIELLLNNKDNIVTYAIIEALVWKEDLMSMDSLRTLIRGIRKKTHPDIITNHNGVGYKINV